jgi:hypothetical protein
MVLPSRRALFALYVACGVAAGSISYALGQSKNLFVFRHASDGLLHGRDLYADGFIDYFKYSPTFALLFLPFALAPAWVAGVAWAILNFGVAFLGIDATISDDRTKRRALVAALPGVLLSTDGDQANLLVAGTMLLAFAWFERNRTILGAGAVAFGALVKIFPIAALLFALLHRDRERSSFRVMLALAVGIVIPLLVLSPSALAAQYVSWGKLVDSDLAFRGWSLVTVGHNLGIPARAVSVCGALVVLGTLVLGIMKNGDAAFRRLFAASVLVACVLFSHRTEYCTFVISAIGVAIWYATGPKSPLRHVVFVLASIAHGPFFVIADPRVTGFLELLGAHRLYHPLRIVPLAIVFVILQLDILRVLAKNDAHASMDLRRAERAARSEEDYGGCRGDEVPLTVRGLAK